MDVFILQHLLRILVTYCFHFHFLDCQWGWAKYQGLILVFFLSHHLYTLSTVDWIVFTILLICNHYLSNMDINQLQPTSNPNLSPEHCYLLYSLDFWEYRTFQYVFIVNPPLFFLVKNEIIDSCKVFFKILFQ